MKYKTVRQAPLKCNCTHLRLAALVGPECHAEDEPVERDDVVLPDEVVDWLDAFRHESRTARLAKLKDEEFTKCAKVRDEVLVSDALQNPERKESKV